MSDEYTVAGRFLMGKIDEAEYLRKMAYMREQEARYDEEMAAAAAAMSQLPARGR